MAKKKAVAVMEVVPANGLDDSKYRAMLIEHLELTTAWSFVGNKAAAGYPERLSSHQATLYKKAVQIAAECAKKYEEIVALNLQPRPDHSLTPFPARELFTEEQFNKWEAGLAKKLNDLVKE